MLGNVQISYDA